MNENFAFYKLNIRHETRLKSLYNSDLLNSLHFSQCVLNIYTARYENHTFYILLCLLYCTKIICDLKNILKMRLEIKSFRSCGLPKIENT